jgi:hypothetical protein
MEYVAKQNSRIRILDGKGVPAKRKKSKRKKSHASKKKR